MYNKNNIAIWKIAAKSQIRPELQCVAFYGDRTIATDSYRAIEMSATGKKRTKPTLYMSRSLEIVKLKKDETIEEDALPIKPGEIENAYPDIDAVFNRTNDKKYAQVVVNAEYLADICTLLKGLDPFKGITLQVPIESAYDPIIITADNSRGTGSGKDEVAIQKARALLMPMSR